MSCHSNQCCSPTSDNKRCPNTVVNGSKHCENHNINAKKLYIKNKKTCGIAYKLDINQIHSDDDKQCKYLMKCYAWLNKAFEARMKHRKYAFVPECYDDGHNYQFEFIQEKMSECEKKLMDLYSIYERALPSIEPKIKKKAIVTYNEDEEYEIHQIKNTIIEQNRRRKIMKQEENAVIDSYIKENKIILERREKLDVFIFKYIMNLVGPCYDVDNFFEYCVAIHHLSRTLWELDYFDDFKPQKCRECACNNFITYELKLVCGCVYHNSTINKYFNLMSEATLKHFYEILLMNKKKIQPLINDLNLYFTMFGPKIIFTEFCLAWNVEEQRLAIVQSEPTEKRSKFLASLRKRTPTRNQYQRLLAMPENWDEIDD